MTGQQLLDRLCDLLADEQAFIEVMTVPQLMHIKAELDRLMVDAISDDATPCPHDGTRWQHPLDGEERCGQCGRRLEREAA